MNCLQHLAFQTVAGKISASDISIILFTDTKTFTVGTPKNLQNHRLNNQEEKKTVHPINIQTTSDSLQVASGKNTPLDTVHFDHNVKVTDAYYHIMNAPSTVPDCQSHHILDFKNSSKFFVLQQDSALVPCVHEAINFFYPYRQMKSYVSQVHTHHTLHTGVRTRD